MDVLYLSTSSFFQVDKEILPDLAKCHNVHFFILIQQSGSNYSYEEIAAFLKGKEINYTAYFFKYRQRDIRSFLFFGKMIADLKAKKGDVLYIVSFDHPVFSVLSYSLKGKKVVIALHDANFHSNFPNLKFHKLARAITLRLFDNYQVYSENQAVWFKEKYPKKNVSTIPLPLSDYQDVQSNAEIVKVYNPIKFLFFGTILHYKGLDILIKAFTELTQKHQNITLIVAGKCDEWDELYKPLLNDNPNIKSNIGYIQNSDIDRLFKECHYLVLPYREATQSGPLMIAYNYNVPVIVSDIDAFTSTVKEDITGYLFKANDTNSLITLLQTLVLKSADDYNELRIKQNQYVDSNFGNDVIIDKYQKMFNSITHNG